MRLHEDRKQIVWSGAGLKVVFTRGRRGVSPPRIYDGTGRLLLARSLSFLELFTSSSRHSVSTIARYECRSGDSSASLALFYSYQGMVDFVISFRPATHGGGCDVVISAALDSHWLEPFAFRALPLVPGRSTRNVRLAAGLYSGWTIGRRTFAVIPETDHAPLLTVQTPVDRVRNGFGVFKEDGPVRCAPICMSYPPALTGCLANRFDERRISGRCTWYAGDVSVTSPSLLERANAPSNEHREIPAPRYGLARYRQSFLEFLDRPEMLVDLRRGFGLFHRGFFNCAQQDSERDALGDAADKPAYSGVLVYRHPAIRAHLADPRSYPTLAVFGDYATMGSPLCDVVWGGAHNLQTVLFLFRQNALVDKAEKVLHTLLQFRNRDGDGFQIGRGKTKGAWWNAYQPELDAFSSRYFRSLVGTADQGLWCHYLCCLYQEGYCRDVAIRQQIVDCCRHFLSPLIESGAGCPLYHAYRTSGKPGYTRENRAYTRQSPFAVIMSALAFLSAYRLTGDSRWKRLARQTAHRCVAAHYRHFDWGWQEYDTLGQDTMGMARTLMALCELYEEFALPGLKQSADDLAAYLYHCQHHYDLRLDRYMDNERSWGGTSVNRGCFLHGYTYNARQGLHTLTFRSDMPEGLLRYFELTGDARTYESVVKYFNVLTFHQVIRRDIAFGFGSTSEHLNLQADYVQDTFQISNAMPYGIEKLLTGLHLSSTSSAIERVAPSERGLTLRFDRRSPRIEISVSHPSARGFRVDRRHRAPHISFDGHIRIDDYRGETIEVRPMAEGAS